MTTEPDDSMPGQALSRYGRRIAWMQFWMELKQCSIM